MRCAQSYGPGDDDLTITSTQTPVTDKMQLRSLGTAQSTARAELIIISTHYVARDQLGSGIKGLRWRWVRVK